MTKPGKRESCASGTDEKHTGRAQSIVLSRIERGIDFTIRSSDNTNVMNKEFQSHIDKLPVLLDRLVNYPLMPRSKLVNIPDKGIYVFYEDGCPIYVGRTNRMRGRIMEHGRQSSNHNTAPFAFNIAKKSATEIGTVIARSRSELEKDPVFVSLSLFLEAKDKVSKMLTRVIEVDDPIIQTLFEVYASIALNTVVYNHFDTH